MTAITFLSSLPPEGKPQKFMIMFLFLHTILECLILFFLSIDLQISMVSLAPVIQRNCKLNCLKTAGCCSLLLQCANVEHINGNKYGDFLHELGTTYCLEDVEMGWGFCPIRIEDLVPSFSKVRKMKIGLGTSLAENVLCALPMICPFLESLILRFQVCPNTLRHVKL